MVSNKVLVRLSRVFNRIFYQLLSGRPRETKPYEFIGFGAMEATKPYEFIRFGAMEATKPYEFIRFGAFFSVQNRINLLGLKVAPFRLDRENVQLSKGLVTCMAPNLLNLWGLVTSMANFSVQHRSIILGLKGAPFRFDRGKVPLPKI